MYAILAPKAVGISEFKINPAAVIEAAEEGPIVLLNRNKPSGYFISCAMWERIHKLLEEDNQKG